MRPWLSLIKILAKIYLFFNYKVFVDLNLNYFQNPRLHRAKLMRISCLSISMKIRFSLFYHSYPTDAKRNFFISHSYGGCASDYGWFMMKDFNSLSGCAEWDQVTGKSYFLYSGDTTKINWASGEWTRQTSYDKPWLFILWLIHTQFTVLG